MTTTDQLANKLLEIINQIQQGVVAHAPDAMNILLKTVQIDCAQNFLITFISGLFLASMAKIFFKIKKSIENDRKLNKSYSERLEWDHGGIIISLLIMAVVSTFALIFFIASIVDVWSWVGLFNPKLYLAHEIIQKVTH